MDDAAKWSAARARLEALSIPEPNTGCWLWLGYVHKGYGRTHSCCGERAAHRASFRLFVGPIPDGVLVLHRCDTPPCINPTHLFLGTTADNVADKIAKGRARYTGNIAPQRGSMNANAKLTPSQVAEIRRTYTGKYGEQSEMARRYGVGATSIIRVVRGETWQHLKGETP